MRCFLWFWPPDLLPFVKSSWLRFRGHTLVFAHLLSSPSVPACVRPANDSCAPHLDVRRAGRVRTKATGFRHAYAALNTQPLRLGDLSAEHLTCHISSIQPDVRGVVRAWSCLVWDCVRPDPFWATWQPLTRALTEAQVQEQEVLENIDLSMVFFENLKIQSCRNLHPSIILPALSCQNTLRNVTFNLKCSVLTYSRMKRESEIEREGERERETASSL